jgi:NADPH2:quinone reductase
MSKFKDTFMFCININNPGPDNRLEIIEAPIPNYSATQILVRVKATALNRADLLQRKGKYPAPEGASPIPGLEIAGEIIAVGSEVSSFKIGERIMALVNGGGYAEYCTAEASLACLIPDEWSYQYAAAIPEALMTVHGTIFEIGKLSKGQILLIHGAGSGIGSLAIQMAKLVDAKVITTVGSETKIDKALGLGATQVINYRSTNFRSNLNEDSIDLILDFIGGDYFNKHLEVLKPLGKLVQIACMKGASIECNIALILKKRLQINGFMLRPQTLDEKTLLWNAAYKHWFLLFLNKQLAPIIDSEFPLQDIEKAHLRMQSGEHFGKIIVKIE